VEQICHQIHECSDGFIRLPMTAVRNPDALARLIPIVYEHITPETDVEHEGVHSPGPRDHAQRIRSQLISWLADIPGEESVAALRRTAEDPRVASIRDWLLHRADQRLVANAGTSEPEVSDVLVELYRRHGTGGLEHLAELKVPTDSPERRMSMDPDPADNTGSPAPASPYEFRILKDSVTLNGVTVVSKRATAQFQIIKILADHWRKQVGAGKPVDATPRLKASEIHDERVRRKWTKSADMENTRRVVTRLRSSISDNYRKKTNQTIPGTDVLEHSSGGGYRLNSRRLQILL